MLFSKIEYKLSNNLKLVVSKNTKNTIQNNNLSFELLSVRPRKIQEKWEILEKDFSIDDDNPSSNRKSLRMWQQIGGDRWYNRSSRELLTANNRQVLARILNKGEYNIPEWLEEIIDSINLLYITDDRLSHDIAQYSNLKFQKYGPLSPLAEKIVNVISSANSTYIYQSRNLDKSFANRVIENLSNDVAPSRRELEKLANEINNKERTLQNLSLIDEGLTGWDNQDKIDKSSSIVLKLYFEDLIDKYKAFDEISFKLEIFINTINDMIMNKQIVVSLKEGFFAKDEKDNIDLSELSSGETHLIFLVGAFIFSADYESLILVDEPEISFHPEWQETFPKFVNTICNYFHNSILISTHSPTIIGDNWNNVIELADQMKT